MKILNKRTKLVDFVIITFMILMTLGVVATEINNKITVTVTTTSDSGVNYATFTATENGAAKENVDIYIDDIFSGTTDSSGIYVKDGLKEGNHEWNTKYRGALYDSGSFVFFNYTITAEGNKSIPQQFGYTITARGTQNLYASESKSNIWGYDADTVNEYGNVEITNIPGINDGWYHGYQYEGDIDNPIKFREIRVNISYDNQFISKPILSVSSTGYAEAMIKYDDWGSIYYSINGNPIWTGLIDERFNGNTLKTYVYFVNYWEKDWEYESYYKWVPHDNGNAQFSYTASGYVNSSWSGNETGSSIVSANEGFKYIATAGLVAPNKDTSWSIANDNPNVNTQMDGPKLYANTVIKEHWSTTETGKGSITSKDTDKLLLKSSLIAPDADTVYHVNITVDNKTYEANLGSDIGIVKSPNVMAWMVGNELHATMKAAAKEDHLFNYSILASGTTSSPICSNYTITATGTEDIEGGYNTDQKSLGIEATDVRHGSKSSTYYVSLSDPSYNLKPVKYTEKILEVNHGKSTLTPLNDKLQVDITVERSLGEYGGNFRAEYTVWGIKRIPWSNQEHGNFCVKATDDYKYIVTSTLVAPNGDTSWAVDADNPDVTTSMNGTCPYDSEKICENTLYASTQYTPPWLDTKSGRSSVKSIELVKFIDIYDILLPPYANINETIFPPPVIAVNNTIYKDFNNDTGVEAGGFKAWMDERTLYASVGYSPPKAIIDSISPKLTEEGGKITFVGHGEDGENPEGKSSVIAYKWRSSKDGILSEESHFNTSSLSPKHHIIFFKVMDNDTIWSPEATDILRINKPPVAYINSIDGPNDNADGEKMVILGDPIKFAGLGIDTDGYITEYVWNSSINGLMSSEPEFSTSTLSEGTHDISFKVKDNEGAWSKEIKTRIRVSRLPVLLVHGYLGSPKDMNKIRDELQKEGLDVYDIDLRGTSDVRIKFSYEFDNEEPKYMAQNVMTLKEYFELIKDDWNNIRGDWGAIEADANKLISSGKKAFENWRKKKQDSKSEIVKSELETRSKELEDALKKEDTEKIRFILKTAWSKDIEKANSSIINLQKEVESKGVNGNEKKNAIEKFKQLQNDLDKFSMDIYPKDVDSNLLEWRNSLDNVPIEFPEIDFLNVRGIKKDPPLLSQEVIGISFPFPDWLVELIKATSGGNAVTPIKPQSIYTAPLVVKINDNTEVTFKFPFKLGGDIRWDEKKINIIVTLDTIKMIVKTKLPAIFDVLSQKKTLSIPFEEGDFTGSLGLTVENLFPKVFYGDSKPRLVGELRFNLPFMDLKLANGEIKSHAADIGEKIVVIKKQTGLPKVDIVGFSMGGLASRWYVNYGYKDDVRKLVILASPNHGSDLAFYGPKVIKMVISSLTSTLGPVGKVLSEIINTAIDYILGDAIRQMETHSSFIYTLNANEKCAPGVWIGESQDKRQDRINPEVQHEVIAGSFWIPPTLSHGHIKFKLLFKKLNFVFPWIDKGDLVVTRDSARLDNVPLEEFDRWHSYVRTKPEPINKVKEFLNYDPPSAGQANKQLSLMSETSTMSDASAMYEESTMSQASQWFDPIEGEIFTTETKTHSVTLDNATTEATFRLQWLDEESDIGMNLISPDGTNITPASADNVTIIYYKAENYIAYNITNPKSQDWTLEITGTNVSNNITRYYAFVTYNTPLFVGIATDQYSYKPDQIVKIYAYVQDNSSALSNVSVNAQVTRPDSIIDIIPLYDDGYHEDGNASDGIYSNNYTATSLFGTYDILANATIIKGNEQYNRIAGTSIWIENNPDLTLTSSDISFSKNAPVHGDNITIKALIHNIENANVTNAKIIFYDGDPAEKGILIGNDFIDVPAESTTEASVSWNATFGNRTIYVIIDPFSKFLEKNYTNNRANRTIFVRDPTSPISDAGSDQTVMVNTMVFFDGSGSKDNVGLVNYSWDIDTSRDSDGDGRPDNDLDLTGVNPNCIGYDQVGKYTVMLTVRDAAGNVDSDTMRVTVTTDYDLEYPLADAGKNQTVTVGESVLFNGGGSEDNFGIITYFWDIDTSIDSDGDGIPDNDIDLIGNDPTFISGYITPGVYIVQLTVDDAAGNGPITDTITITAKTKPDLFIYSEDVIYKPSNPKLTQEVETNVLIHNDGETDVTDAKVEFWLNDNLKEIRTFSVMGKSSVKVTFNWIVDSRGLNIIDIKLDPDNRINEEYEDNNQIRTYIIVNEPPTANAGGPYTSYEGSPITFNSSGSNDPDGNIYLYEWDLDGDGIFETNTSTTNHTWYDDYAGNISLKVTDSWGETDVDHTNVTVLNVPPTSEAGQNRTVYLGYLVIFNGSATDPGRDNLTFKWEFGDRTNATGINTTHIYFNKGNYNATLTVMDDDGGIGTDSIAISVIASPSTGGGGSGDGTYPTATPTPARTQTTPTTSSETVVQTKLPPSTTKPTTTPFDPNETVTGTNWIVLMGVMLVIGFVVALHLKRKSG